jgi:hypothetical protein
LTRPDVQVIVPNPKTASGARWAFLALWVATAKAKTHDLSTPEGLKESIAATRTAQDFPAYKKRRSPRDDREILHTQRSSSR